MAIDPAGAEGNPRRARWLATDCAVQFADAALNADAGGAIGRERIARGQTPVGRKIGFTNRNIWAEYGVFAPIWGEVYDGAVVDVVPGAAVAISHLPQPRVEAEILLGLDRDLDPGMPPEAIEASIASSAGS